MMTSNFFAILCLCLSTSVLGFAPTKAGMIINTRTLNSNNSQLYADATAEEVTIDPKEAVKIFGRLAEKYIMLDSSGGMCCYSACTGKFNKNDKYIYICI